MNPIENPGQPGQTGISEGAGGAGGPPDVGTVPTPEGDEGPSRMFPSWRDLVDGTRRALAASIRIGTWGWRWLIGRFAFTACAVLATYFVLFVLPQTQHLIWQFPSLRGLSGSELTLSLFFLCYIFAIIFGYVYLVSRVEPRAIVQEGWSPGRPDAQGRWPRLPAQVDPPGLAQARGRSPWEFLVRRAEALTSAQRQGRGWGMFLLGAALFWLTRRYEAALPSWWRTTGLTLTFLLAVTGLWLAGTGGRDLRRVVTGQRPRLEYRMTLTGRALLIFLATSLIGIFIWALTSWAPSLFSSRVYTIWAIAHFCFTLILVALVIDALHVYSTWNVRLLVMAGLLLGLAVMPSQKVGRFWRLPPLRSSRNVADRAAVLPAPLARST